MCQQMVNHCKEFMVTGKGKVQPVRERDVHLPEPGEKTVMRTFMQNALSMVFCQSYESLVCLHKIPQVSLSLASSTFQKMSAKQTDLKFSLSDIIKVEPEASDSSHVDTLHITATDRGSLL